METKITFLTAGLAGLLTSAGFYGYWVDFGALMVGLMVGGIVLFSVTGGKCGYRLRHSVLGVFKGFFGSLLLYSLVVVEYPTYARDLSIIFGTGCVSVVFLPSLVKGARRVLARGSVK